MLRHPPLRALCHSVKKNTDSLVKGMILFAQGGGLEGDKVMVKSAPPHQSVVRLFFDVVCAKYFFFFPIFILQLKNFGGKLTCTP